MAGPSVDRSLADRALASVGAPEHALVVGSGAMAERLATGLGRRAAHLAISSRTPERAAALAGRVGARTVAWDGALLDGRWDLIAFATRVSEPLLDVERATALPHAAVIDLCAPSAVAAEARTILGERLVDLDTLGAAGTSTLSERARHRLEALVAEEADRYLAWLAELTAFDAVSQLHARAAELRDRYLGRLRKSDRFDEAQLAAVDRMTTQLVGELLHEPTLRLRAGGRP
jgi:glutamyl-tRNA reductase